MELLLRQTDARNRREQLIKAVENAIKLKYQLQNPEILSAVNKEKNSRFVELQQQNSSIGRMIILISALQDVNQILNYLDLEERKRAIVEKIVHNEQLRDERSESGEDVEEDYAAAWQELLRERSDLKMIIEALLKSGEAGAILRSLGDVKQRLADVRASVPADKSNKNGKSPQKELTRDNEQKEHDGHNADDSSEPQNGARSLPKEEMSIGSQGGKKQKRQNFCDFNNIKCKTSNAFGAESSQRAEKLQKRREKLEREAKQVEREAKEKEIADLQEEVARKARTAERKKRSRKFCVVVGLVSEVSHQSKLQTTI